MSENKNNNMLDNIINTPSTKDETNSEADNQNNVSTKKKPISTADFLKFIWAIFAVTLIIFSSFLAYIVFNPSDAKQFLLMFWISPVQIQSLLYSLVNTSFWLVTLFTSIIWIIFLFKAILTKKEYKRKKTISTVIAIFLWLLFFSVITLWLFLIRQIWVADYENPDWWVILYDNSKLISTKFKEIADDAQLKENDFNNIIWPITIRFDLKSDIKYWSQRYIVKEYKIDFDWDGKADKISSSTKDDIIINTYNKKWSYNPKLKYTVIDKITKEEKEVDWKLPSLNVIWVVEINQKPRSWWIYVTLDATDIKELWAINWYSEKEMSEENPKWKKSIKYIATVNGEELVCMMIENNKSNKKKCDKIFLIWASSFKWEILIERNEKNDKEVIFSVKSENEDIEIDPESYNWILWSTTFKNETSDTLKYKFSAYWDYKIEVSFKDINWQEYKLEKDITLYEPITVNKWKSNLVIYNESETNILENTYNPELWFYNITNFKLPQTIKFDSSSVISNNKDYELKSTKWDFWDWKINSGTTFEKLLDENKKYEIKAIYTFESKITWDIQDITEKIVIDWKDRNVDLKLVINFENDSNMAPATVNFDASASQAKSGKIARYVFDFWDNKWTSEWWPVQSYKYMFPGNYKVKLTTYTNEWKSEMIEKDVIITDTEKKVIINTSISEWVTGKYVDFDTLWTSGQISSYTWDFWDQETSTDPKPSHKYDSAGQYTIKLTITYVDWTTKTWTRYFTVKDEE